MMELVEELSGGKGDEPIGAYREELQRRMTNAGSHIRRLDEVGKALEEAYGQIGRFARRAIPRRIDIPHALADRHLAIAHAAYLDAIKTYLEAGGGSRGSYLVMDDNGEYVLEQLGEQWRYKPEEPSLREKVLRTVRTEDGAFTSEFIARRPIPVEDYWFENVWNAYLRREIYERT
jgi:hypothetical protein